MRLSEDYIRDIKETFKQYFLPGDHLWLFGSRVDLEKRGGDIDLYIETNYKDIKKVHEAENKFWIDLQDKLGEQKIDIVVKYNDTELLIYEIARKEGVLLV